MRNFGINFTILIELIHTKQTKTTTQVKIYTLKR